MSAKRLCTYRYDPLDRLTHHTVATHAPIQRFYCKSRLATEIEGLISRSIIQHDDQLLALTETQGKLRQATLLATDQQRSVLRAIASNESQSHAYSPYGSRTIGNGLLSLLGFNGQRPDSVTGHYLLGNGYRAFNPVLMRFNSPDKLSPFGRGGLNSYTYCLGDPINKIDPTGHLPIFLAKLLGIKPIIISDQYMSKPGVTARTARRMYTRILELELERETLRQDAQHAAFNQDKLIVDAISVRPQHPLRLEQMAYRAARTENQAFLPAEIASHFPRPYDKIARQAATYDVAGHADLFTRIDESMRRTMSVSILTHIQFITHSHEYFDPRIASSYEKRMRSIRTDKLDETIAEIRRIQGKYFAYYD